MSERPLDRPPSEPADDAVAAERAPYAPPTLTELGTLADLTRGAAGSSGADLGLYVS
jgi:hypothetical protein